LRTWASARFPRTSEYAGFPSDKRITALAAAAAAAAAVVEEEEAGEGEEKAEEGTREGAGEEARCGGAADATFSTSYVYIHSVMYVRGGGRGAGGGFGGGGEMWRGC
jgi:hypothetical protein